MSRLNPAVVKLITSAKDRARYVELAEELEKLDALEPSKEVAERSLEIVDEMSVILVGELAKR